MIVNNAYKQDTYNLHCRKTGKQENIRLIMVELRAFSILAILLKDSTFRCLNILR